MVNAPDLKNQGGSKKEMNQHFGGGEGISNGMLGRNETTFDEVNVKVPIGISEKLF